VRRRLGEPQSRYGRYEEEKNTFPLPGIEPHFLGRSPDIQFLTDYLQKIEVIDKW
jgi:hypothetical protein